MEDAPAPVDTPTMARVANDADDLRDVFAAQAPGLQTAEAGRAAIGPIRADEPGTCEDHPPVRPPRRPV